MVDFWMKGELGRCRGRAIFLPLRLVTLDCQYGWSKGLSRKFNLGMHLGFGADSNIRRLPPLFRSLLLIIGRPAKNIGSLSSRLFCGVHRARSVCLPGGGVGHCPLTIVGVRSRS